MYRPLFLVLLLISLSCNKSNDENLQDASPDSIEEGTLSFTLDGNLFEMKTAIASIVNTSVFGEMFIIAAGDINNGIFSFGLTLFVPENIDLEEKKYETIGLDCDSSTDVCNVLIIQGTSAFGISEDDRGRIEVTFSSLDYQLGGHAIGSFNGILVTDPDSQETILLENGKFNLEIIE